VAAISGAVRALRHRIEGDSSGRSWSSDGVLAMNLDLIEQQSDRLAAITREISDFGRPRELEHTLLDLNQVIRSAVSIMRFDPRVQDAALSVRLDPELPALTASPDLLTQLVINLLLNAADACEGMAEGRIEIATAPAGHNALLVVSDSGVGMDEETMKHALDPYFTTKGGERGMGLGLSLCQDIVDEHHGKIILQSVQGQGTTVRVLLPLDEES
jgi:signal transduction histidine kinase